MHFAKPHERRCSRVWISLIRIRAAFQRSSQGSRRAVERELAEVSLRCHLRRLTFDMSGSQRRDRPRRSEALCPAVGCPFDGRVRPAVRQKQSGGCLLALSSGTNQLEQRGVFHEKPQCAGQARTRQPGLSRSGASQVSLAQECLVLVFLQARTTTRSMASKDAYPRWMRSSEPG